ncbi:MAG: hypothetical protein GYA87_06075 [Christensenellaceae bacterium]|nr:hypothetical protein [Christensenellaceae bacterium]
MPEEAPPSSTEAPAQVEDPPVSTEAPAPMEAPIPTEAPVPVVTEIPTEQPAPTEQAIPTEEPAPTEQPTREPLPSPTVQADITDKAGWQHAPKKSYIFPHETNLGSSFKVLMDNTEDIGGTGKYTFAYYIYKGNTVVQKTAYSKALEYVYKPKTIGKYYAVVFVKNEKGEIRTLKSAYTNVVETQEPIDVKANIQSGNVVLGDAKRLEIQSWGGNNATRHMHAYYVYHNNKLVERFPYIQAEDEYELNYYSYITYTPKNSGKYKFTVFAKDASGKAKGYTTEDFSVISSPLELRANVALKKYNIGSLANITAQASGGSGKYQYAYYVYKNNALIERFSYTAKAEFNYTPKSEGTYRVRVFVKDSLGAFKTDDTSDFLVENFQLNVHLDSEFKNNLFYHRAYPEGGLPPYQYAHYIYRNNALVEKLPYTVGYGDGVEKYFGFVFYKPKSSGTYKILTFVKDAAGTIKTATTQEVNVDFDLKMTAYPSIEGMVFLGNNINVKTYVNYGEGFYQYAYYIYKDGALLKKLPYTNNANFAYKPESKGTYKILVFVRDDTGKIVFGMSNECDVIDAEPLHFHMATIPSAALLNNQIYVGAHAFGGVQPYQYAYYIYHNNKLIKKTAYSEYDKSYSFTATSPGIYHATAFIKDAAGAIVYGPTTNCEVSSNPQPNDYQEMFVSANVNVNASILEIVGGAEYGMPPYQRAYYLYKDGVRVHTSGYSKFNNLFWINYNAAESGTYKVIVFVKDSIGKIKMCTIDNIYVDIFGEPTINMHKFESNVVNLGYEFKVITEIENAKWTDVAYNVYKDGALYYKSNFYDVWNDPELEWTFRPNHVGTYSVKILVRTANGQIISQNTSNYCEVD